MTDDKKPGCAGAQEPGQDQTAFSPKNSASHSVAKPCNAPPFLPREEGPDVPVCIYCGDQKVAVTHQCPAPSLPLVGMRFRLCMPCYEIALGGGPVADHMAVIIREAADNALTRCIARCASGEQP